MKNYFEAGVFMEETEFKAIMRAYGVKSESYIDQFWKKFGQKMTLEDLKFVLELFHERATKEEKDRLFNS